MARTGRPRGFDKDEAVRRAMLLFWERGFAATSLAELKTAMGDISAASFYAAFVSKAALFAEVLDRYLATHGQVTAPLRDPTSPPREAIERALRQSARMQTDPGHPLGCLLVLAASSRAPEDQRIQEQLTAERDRNRTCLRACVERAIANGELAGDTDATPLASLFDTFLLGLTAQARDRVPLPALDTAITQLMRVWDAFSVTEAPGEP